MTNVEVDVEDLRLLLTEVDRIPAAPQAAAAATRLREAIAPTLFGPSLSDINAPDAGAAHHRGRTTERAATDYTKAPKRGSQRHVVLEALAAADHGLTDNELAETTGIYLYSAAPRRLELVRGGWVRDSGLRRPTPHKADAVVWVLTTEARDRLREESRP